MFVNYTTEILSWEFWGKTFNRGYSECLCCQSEIYKIFYLWVFNTFKMSRSFLMDSIINNPHCGQSSPPSPLSSPASLPSSPGSPFPYPFGGYLFSFMPPHGFPKPATPALSMLYPPYPLYDHDAKLVRPVPLPTLRKPASAYSPHHRPRPAPKTVRGDLKDTPLSLPGMSSVVLFYYILLYTTNNYY